MNGYFSTLRENAELLFEMPSNDSKLFNYLIYRASFKETPLVKIGCLFDSLRGLSSRVGLTVRETRTSLQHLMSVGLIELKRHNKRHDIRLTGYINPALGDTISDKQTTQQRHNNDTTTTQLEELRSKEVKKELTPTFKSDASDFERGLNLEFQRLWTQYPKPRGKKAALRHFLASVISPSDLAAIQSALKSYLADIDYNRTTLQYTQNGSTWFNDWQSWVPHEKPKLIAPKPIYRPPEPVVEPTDEDFRVMHALTVKTVGRCRHEDCRFCIKSVSEVSA